MDNFPTHHAADDLKGQAPTASILRENVFCLVLIGLIAGLVVKATAKLPVVATPLEVEVTRVDYGWSTIWATQIKRIKANIVPFWLIGLAAGAVIGASTQLKEISWLNSYLNYANIEIDYSTFGSSVLFEHLAPNTLILLLVLIGMLSALHRILFGVTQSSLRQRRGIIFSLENFASLLAIAWLGIMLGLLVAGLLFAEWRSAAELTLLTIYPALYLAEVSTVTVVMHGEFIFKRPASSHGTGKWNLLTRLEGLIILLGAFALLTFYKQYDVFFKTTLPDAAGRFVSGIFHGIS